jgi:hypothetical protein
VYVRDAAGLAVPTDYPLPPLAPAVPLRADLAPYATSAAAEAWTAWWEQACTIDRSMRQPDVSWVRSTEPPEPGTDLRALFDAVVDEAHDWHRARFEEFHGRRLRRRDHGGTAGQTVRRMERELGRRSASFSLHVWMLPLDRKWGRRMEPDLVVVSEQLWYDQDACDLFLDRILRSLM